MNIVVPLAGRGKRFADRGFETPKPLIQINGRPMLFWALQSLKGIQYNDIIFISLKEHEREYGISEVIDSSFPHPHQLMLLDQVTEGQLCTVLMAKEWINNEQGLLIASADTYVVSKISKEILVLPEEIHGLISVASVPGDHWSFARTDASGHVIEVAEKVRISNHASTGIYYFSKGYEFVSMADQMIINQEKTKGEFYVIPVYQKYIQRGWAVGVSEASELHDMGTPESMAKFTAFLANKLDKTNE